MNIPIADLLANDSDVDGDILSITGVNSAINGTATLSGTNEIVFTPSDSWPGNGSFQYTVSDGNLATDEANVVIRESGALNFRVLATNGPKGNVIQWDGVTGEFLGDFIPKGIAQSPSAIDIGPEENIYVLYNGALFNNEKPSVHSFSIDGDHLGEYTSLAGVDTISSTVTSDMEFDGEGNLYILDIGGGFGHTEVLRFQGPAGEDPGAFVETFLTPDLIQFQSRRMISYDMEAGPDGNLYFGSVGSHDILRFKTPGGEDFGWYGEQLIGSWQTNPENPLEYIAARDIYRSHTWDTDSAYPGIRPFGIDWDENGHLFVVADELERENRNSSKIK